MQGEVLSPILFSFYVNDFENEFIANSNCALEFQDITLFLLMYADDMILMSETVEGLQEMLNTLQRRIQGVLGLEPLFLVDQCI